MFPEDIMPHRTDLLRRSLLRAAAAVPVLALPALPAIATGRRIALVVDPVDPVAATASVQWAVGMLMATLAAKGHSVETLARAEAAAPGVLRIVLAGAQHVAAKSALADAGAVMPDEPEALALLPIAGGDGLLVAGSDARGLVYAITELADRVSLEAAPGVGLALGPSVLERPASAVRGIARCFESEQEDKSWLQDRSFWPDYLSQLAANRVNRFSLTFGMQYNYPMEVSDVYLYFAYPFLLEVPGYKISAHSLPASERDANLAALKFIAAETVRRGMDFQLGLWTHAYAYDSPRVNYRIEGITKENHAVYCRDALALLLREVPEISGITFRIHGESGIPEGDFVFWRTVFAAITGGGRRIGIDMHSKGIDQATIDVALETGMPVTVSPKYLAEHIGLPYHPAAIRRSDMAPVSATAHFGLSEGSRRWTRYSYADFLKEDRTYQVVWRVWPGTQRFLLWADPVLFAGYGRNASFAGADGIEFCEPLSFKGRMGSGRPDAAGRHDRTGYADTSLMPARDWQKYEVFYRMWGRLTYNPATPAGSLRRHFNADFGPGASAAMQALAQASRILPLVTLAHGPSVSNNSYWPELYTNMPIARDMPGRPYYDTPAPPRFQTVETFDRRFFQRMDEAAGILIEGRTDARYSPMEVAAWLDALAAGAMSDLGRTRAASPPTPELRRLAVDVTILSSLGRFFAAKFRAGVLWGLHLAADDAVAGVEAIKAYRNARDAWCTASVAGAAYADDISYGMEPWLRGHWKDQLPAIDADIADLERALGDVNGPAGGSKTHVPTERRFAALGRALTVEPRSTATCRHTQPAAFGRGNALALTLEVSEEVQNARLRYRHVSQAEEWQEADMAAIGGGFAASITATYTDAPYALQYYFEVRTQAGATLWPGLAPTLADVPYFVLRMKA
jgi:hypothetical protein